MVDRRIVLSVVLGWLVGIVVFHGWEFWVVDGNGHDFRLVRNIDHDGLHIHCSGHDFLHVLLDGRLGGRGTGWHTSYLDVHGILLLCSVDLFLGRLFHDVFAIRNVGELRPEDDILQCGMP